MKKQSTKQSKLQKTVMQKIITDDIKMRPRAYFIALSTLLGTVSFLLTIVFAYSISVLTLWIRIQNASGPAYGARRNLAILLQKFPWWAVLLAFFAMVLVAITVKKIGSLYKIRLPYIIAAVTLIAVILGFALSYSRLPNYHHNNMPINRGMMHGRHYKMK